MTGQRLSNALVPLHAGTGPALFMVHPAGGSVAAYRDLARDLDRACFGLAASEPLPGTLEALAQGYVAAVRAAAPGPYTILGWSSGAVIALEMTTTSAVRTFSAAWPRNTVAPMSMRRRVTAVSFWSEPDTW